MSYLSATPRLVFSATDASTNVSTANNDLIADICDFTIPQLINTESRTPADLRTHLMELVGLNNWLPAPQLLTAMRGWWNYYGDHLTTLGSASVTSAILTPGGSPVTGDPIAGASVSLNSVMVDLNPADTFNTQLFFWPLNVVANIGGTPVSLIRGLAPTVAPSRWLNENRPYGAASFQCVIPAKQLTFAEPGTSTTVDRLAEWIAEKGGGLLVRFAIFAFNYQYQADYVRQQFLAGNFISNPKIGSVVGSIQPWSGADLATGPSGRILFPEPSVYSAPQLGPVTSPPPASRPRRRIKTHEDVARLAAPTALASAAVAQDPFIPGPVVAFVDHARMVVVFDLLATYAWQGPANLLVYLRYTNANGLALLAPFGTISFDATSYAAASGIFEVPYAPALDPYMDAGAFALLSEWTPSPTTPVITTLTLTETTLPQVDTDDRCVYMQLGQTATIRLRVMKSGQPMQQPLTLAIEQWDDAITSGTEGPPTPPNPYPTATYKNFFFTKHPQDGTAAVPPSINVPVGGLADLMVKPQTPGCFKIRLIPPGAAVAEPPNQPDFTVEYFANVRVLPVDDFSTVPDDVVRQWSFIYQNIFQYYSILYPVMSKFIPWGPDDAPNDPVVVARFAEQIRYFTSTEMLPSPLYMPLTRELSDGKRTLLHRWCALNAPSSLSKDA